MKRHNLRTVKLYSKENGENITRHAVQLKMRGKNTWIQAKKDNVPLIFDTKEEAEKVIIDFMEEMKKSISEQINDGKVKVNVRR